MKIQSYSWPWYSLSDVMPLQWPKWMVEPF